MKNISNLESVKTGNPKLITILRATVLEPGIEETSRIYLNSENGLVEMQFSLKQHEENNGTLDQEEHPLAQSSQNYLIYFLGFKGSVSYAPNMAAGGSRLDIRFNLAFLESMIAEDCPETLQLLEEHSSKLRSAGAKDHHISAQMKMIINELLFCTRSGKMKQLFQLWKILELAQLQIAQVGETTKPLVNIKSYDIEKLQEAKSIVENNLANPYSLKNLAHKVGLNDFKLKRGFKELFGFTVFGYLHELRMLKAKRMLLTEKDSVTEVSGEVGYQHPHHFSAAFKKRFGILPGSLNK